MRMSLRMCQCMICSTCGQIMDSEPKESAMLTLVLKGDPYRICPGCLQTVDEEDRTPQYKRKWSLKVKSWKNS